jgi:subtilisin
MRRSRNSTGRYRKAANAVTRNFLGIPIAAACVTIVLASTAKMQAGIPATAQGEGQRTAPATSNTTVSPEVLRQAAETGRARVIVGLAVAFAPEGRLRALERLQQRAKISIAQDAVESALSGFAIDRVKRLHVIPAMALELDAAAAARLSTLREVSYIEPDRLESISLAESSPLIGAPAVWSSGYTGAGQTVAILDTGVDRTHPFFGGRVVSEACYSTSASLAPYGTATAVCSHGSTAVGSGGPCDATVAGCFHGTHVAGIAAGSGSSAGVGFSGVAPRASIIAIQVFSRIDSTYYCSPSPCALSFTSDQLSGLERVYELRDTYHIAAVNLSLGGSTKYTSPCDGSDLSRTSMFNALRSAGIAPVVASGNSGWLDGLSEPACISSAVSVGSTTDGSLGTPVDSVSSFSNSASFLSLLAPGQWITSSMPGGGFATFAGTSMAAPQVAGAWALIKSRFSDATVPEVLTALQSTGINVMDTRDRSTKPRIAVSAAMAAFGPACTYSISPIAASVPVSGSSGTITVVTDTGCPWTASVSAAFVSITSIAYGAGAGSIAYTVAANLSGTRSATITIAGQTFSITQWGHVQPVAVDLNSDRHMDLIWQNQADGRIAGWLMNGTTQIAATAFSTLQLSDVNWKIVGAGDLDADGNIDLVWQNVADGRVSAWLMNGLTIRDGSLLSIPQVPDTEWRIRAVGDVNGDGKADLIWQHDGNGEVSVWLMNGLNVIEGALLSPPQVTDLNWKIVGAADFDGNGTRDLVWQHETDGRIAVWFMNGLTMIAGTPTSPDRVSDTHWKIRGVGDLNGDGHPDLIWQNTADGQVSAWLMNGLNAVDGRLLTPSVVADTNWQIVAPR